MDWGVFFQTLHVTITNSWRHKKRIPNVIHFNLSCSFFCLSKVTDLRIGHGLGPGVFGNPAQLFHMRREQDVGRLYENSCKKRMKKKKAILNWCTKFFTDKMFATTQDHQTLRNSGEKQYCQYWILCLVVLTRFHANRDCLLKLYIRVSKLICPTAT